MSKARYTTDDYASDQIERPVLVNGTLCHVLAAPDESTVVVQAYQAGDRHTAGRPFGEPVTIALTECIPLCADCCEELEESEDFGPGECHNPECFLCIA